MYNEKRWFHAGHLGLLLNGHDLAIYLRQRDLSVDKLPPFEFSCQHTIDPRYTMDTTTDCVRYIDSCLKQQARDVYITMILDGWLLKTDVINKNCVCISVCCCSNIFLKEWPVSRLPHRLLSVNIYSLLIPHATLYYKRIIEKL